jgi:hypothetical protein
MTIACSSVSRSRRAGRRRGLARVPYFNHFRKHDSEVKKISPREYEKRASADTDEP